MLLKLGPISFQTNGTGYKKLSQTHTHQWDEQKLIGTNPALQYGGYSKTISISGTLLPSHGRGKESDLNTLNQSADKPLLVVSGTGEILGYWCITNITNNRDLMFQDGEARKITYTISLKYYGQNYP